MPNENIEYCEECQAYVVTHDHITREQYQGILNKAIRNYIRRHKVKHAKR